MEVQGWVATLTQSGALPTLAPIEAGGLLCDGHSSQATLGWESRGEH